MNGILNSYKEKLKPFGHDNLDIFIQADPTGKKYVRWIVDSYVNGGIKRDEDLLSRLKPALEKYEYLKSRNILVSSGQQWEQETNIDNFCGIVGCQKKGFEKPGLEDLIDKYKDQLEKEEVETSNTAVQVYNGDTIRIIQPTTEADACYYGQSTRWCTAAKNDNMFDYYNNLGPLYIIIPNNPSFKDEKYQISFEGKQYMDEQDEEVKLEDLVAMFPEIKIGLQKYFLPLKDSDFNDPTTAVYNADRAIVENNLDVLKEIMSRFPNIKPNLENISSVEMYDFFSSNIQIDNKSKISIYKNAILKHDNDLFDKLSKYIDRQDIDQYYRYTIIYSDNLYAFKKDVNKNIKDIYSAISNGASNILKYLLDFYINDHYLLMQSEYLFSLMERVKKIEDGALLVYVRIIENDKTQSIVNILDSFGLLEREQVKKYIIDKNALEMLDFISFDSRTALEITSIVENKLLQRKL
jgi:hypothetical protein